MSINNEEYQQRDSDEYVDLITETLLEKKPDASTSGSTLINAINTAFSETISETVEPSLSAVFDAGYIENASGKELTKRAGELGFIRQEAVKATGYVEFSRNQPASTDYTIPEGTEVTTIANDPVSFVTTEEVTLTSGTTSVQANIKAVSGGVDGNVGANTIQSMPSPPTGIGGVTNPEPTGDPSVTDMDGDTLIVGQNRENDEKLRQRVLRESGSPESASAEDIEATIADLDAVIESTAFVNATSTDNTGSGGLPPYSTELVVQGGDSQRIIDKLHEVMSLIDFRRLSGGQKGTEVTETVYEPLTEETVTGRISRPTIVDPAITVDIVVTDLFVGEAAVKDSITEYTGGTNTDSEEEIGLTLGEDIFVDELETVVGAVEGVRGITNVKIDQSGDGTDDTTTNANGLDVLTIAQNETVFINASNDVTINTTQA